MPVLIVRDEHSIDDLRPRLVGHRGPGETPERLVAAVREANPHVDLDDLQPGVVLTIPDIEDAKVRDDDTPTELLAEGIDAMVAAIGDVIATAGERAAQAAKVESADRATLRRSLQLKAVTQAAKQDKELHANLQGVKQALAAADETADQAATARERAIARWTEDLERVRALRG